MKLNTMIIKCLVFAICILTGYNSIARGCDGYHISADKQMPLNAGDSTDIRVYAGGVMCDDIDSCKWYRNDTLIPALGVHSVNYNAKKPGIYKAFVYTHMNKEVTLTISVGFKSSSTIQESDMPNAAIYPLGTRGSYVIDITGNEGIYLLEIIDINGNKLMYMECAGKTQFDISAFANGIYIASARKRNGNIFSRTKLVVF